MILFSWIRACDLFMMKGFLMNTQDDQVHYLKDHFDEIKEAIRVEYDITSIAYETWVLPLFFIDMQENTVLIGIPKEIGQATLPYFTKNYRDVFKVHISEILGFEVDIRFEQQKDPYIIKEETQEAASSSDRKLSTDDEIRFSNLNPHYTFDTFVVGKNNNLAQAASVAVAESPGEAYNPLFLYSDAGLGKTHLMHSIGNYILQHRPNARVLYVTSEAFTNEVIASIRSNNTLQDMSKLRKKYRDVDVLMVDDVQFIIGKESTQEEFFHTFNELHSAGKQIVLSSDKPPKNMTTLEERFRSRFEWGLIADIQPPDYETRMAILQKNAANCQIPIDDEVFSYIANNIRSNIRELEGALNKVIVQAKIRNAQRIDQEIAESSLRDIISERDSIITPASIIEKTCDFFHISKEDIVSQKRSREISTPRQVAMYFIRMLTDTSYDEIGRLLGGRDHTTVMSGITKITEQIKKDPPLSEQVDNLKKKIQPDV